MSSQSLDDNELLFSADAEWWKKVICKRTQRAKKIDKKFSSVLILEKKVVLILYFHPHSEHAGHEPWPVSDGVWCVCPLPGQRGPQWSPPPDPGQQLATGLRPEQDHTLLRDLVRKRVQLESQVLTS